VAEGTDKGDSENGRRQAGAVSPAPRTPQGTPDLSGIWRLDSGAYAGNIVADLKPGEIQPWAAALYDQRMENLGKDDPATFKCLP
jgi:hypothetical protein